MSKQLRYALSGVVLVGGLVGIVFLIRMARPRLPVTSVDSPRAKGPANAPLQIIEYSDFQCPACQMAQSELSALFKEFPEKIRLIYQHFPLESHPWSPLAHHSAECAAEQDRFWGFHDRLYATQSIWSKSPTLPLETFMGYAKDEGLDLDRFSRCLADERVDAKILVEKSAGLGLGVRSTPSFFVNGKLVLGVQNLRKKVEGRE